MQSIRVLARKYKNVFCYVFFGVLTTLVNYLVYFPLYVWLSWPAAICNLFAWSVAVAFAYLTNKRFVFKSDNWSKNTVINELHKFVGCRLGSGLIETVLLWLLVDIMRYNGNMFKILISILVVMINYISSKWFVFNRKETT